MHEFTLSGYISLLDALRGRGYSIRSFSEVEAARAHLVLRHDIDFDLASALLLARREAENGLSATYFVLMAGEFYNTFSGSGRDVLREIARLGHTVGLHFDAALHAPDVEELRTAMALQCDMLEDLLEHDVTMVSFHRPHPDILQTDLAPPGRMNAYAPKFFKDIGYCSDSRGAWHHGHPLQHQAVNDHRALQLLTHPIWWTSDGYENPTQRLRRWLAGHQTHLHQHLLQQCQAYRPESGEN